VRVEHHREEDNEGKEYDAHTAIIGFHTKEGQSLTFESHRVGTSRSSVGQVVPVLYDPDDPTEARIPSAFVTWIVPALVALLGLALFALGVALPFLQ
jgi:hypothetical protein